MSKFVQLHILTSYPASNLNRDDMGRPKTVNMGNSMRLRVSSQSLKRAWRTSEIFGKAVGEAHRGIRTKSLGRYVFAALTAGCTLEEVLGDTSEGSLPKLKQNAAVKIARAIANVFGKVKAEFKPGKKGEEEAPEDLNKKLQESMEIEQLAHIGQREIVAVSKLVEQCRESGKEPEAEDLKLLRHNIQAADIGMFGRMLAASPDFNQDASVQVAHAMTVHDVTVEDDFFTAVDDLNRDDSGAGHVGVAEFGAGLYYLYVCIDRELLRDNLDGDSELAGRAIAGLVEAACKVAPTGKQNSFASRARASYVLAEKGDDEPRNLSVAFLDSLKNRTQVLETAIERLEQTRERMDKVYGMQAESCTLNASTGEGSLAELIEFAAK